MLKYRLHTNFVHRCHQLDSYLCVDFVPCTCIHALKHCCYTKDLLIKTHGRVSVAKRDTRLTVCYLQEAESC